MINDDELRSPVWAHAQGLRRLPGISGAEVALVTFDREHWIVRKAASTRDGNSRLRAQAQRQSRLAAAAGCPLRVPNILGDGEIERLYYFDMEQVSGLDAVSYLRRAQLDSVTNFADQLSEYLRWAHGQPPLASIASPSLAGALRGRVARLTDTLTPADTKRRAIYRELRDVVEMLDSLEVTPTLCHGDLTLENMMVDREGQLWAIDLLDAPYEHYWFDFAKLNQDLEGGWYLRHQPPISAAVRQHLRQRCLSTVLELDPRYEAVHNPLMAVTFARILPYATGADAEFTLERVRHYLSRSESVPVSGGSGCA